MSLFPAYSSEQESGDAGPPAKVPRQTSQVPVIDICEDSEDEEINSITEEQLLDSHSEHDHSPEPSQCYSPSAPTAPDDYYDDRKLDQANIGVSTLYTPGRPLYTYTDETVGITSHKKSSKQHKTKRYYVAAKKLVNVTVEPHALLRDEVTLLEKAIHKDPHNLRVWNKYLDYQMQRGQAALLSSLELANSMKVSRGALLPRLLQISQLARPAREHLHYCRDLLATNERSWPHRGFVWAMLLTAVAHSADSTFPDVRAVVAAAVADRLPVRDYLTLQYLYGCYLANAGLWEILVRLIELLAAMNLEPIPDIPHEPVDLTEAEDKICNSGLPLEVVWRRVETLRASAYWRPVHSAQEAGADPQRVVTAADVADLLLPVVTASDKFVLAANIFRWVGVGLAAPLGGAGAVCARALHGASGPAAQCARGLAADAARDWLRACADTADTAPPHPTPTPTPDPASGPAAQCARGLAADAARDWLRACADTADTAPPHPTPTPTPDPASGPAAQCARGLAADAARDWLRACADTADTAPPHPTPTPTPDPASGPAAQCARGLAADAARDWLRACADTADTAPPHPTPTPTPDPASGPAAQCARGLAADAARDWLRACADTADTAPPHPTPTPTPDPASGPAAQCARGLAADAARDWLRACADTADTAPPHPTPTPDPASGPAAQCARGLAADAARDWLRACADTADTAPPHPTPTPDPASGPAAQCARGLAADAARDWLRACADTADTAPPHPTPTPDPASAGAALLADLLEPPADRPDRGGFSRWAAAACAAAAAGGAQAAGAARAALTCMRLRNLRADAIVAQDDEERNRICKQARQLLKDNTSPSPVTAAEYALVQAGGRLEPASAGGKLAVLAVRTALTDVDTTAVERIYVARIVGRIYGEKSNLSRWAMACAVLGKALPSNTDVSPSRDVVQAALLQCQERCAAIEEEISSQLADDEEPTLEPWWSLLPGEEQWALARSCWIQSRACPNEWAESSNLRAVRYHHAVSVGGRLAAMFALHPYDFTLGFLWGSQKAWARVAAPRPPASPVLALVAALPHHRAALAAAGDAPHLWSVCARVWSRALRERACSSAGACALRGAAARRAGTGGGGGEGPAAWYAALDLHPQHKWLYVAGSWCGLGREAADLLLEKQLRLHALPDELLPL